VSVRDFQPVNARCRTESIANRRVKWLGSLNPQFQAISAIPSRRTLVGQQPLGSVQPAGIQLMAEGRARGGEQQMNVAPRQAHRRGDLRGVEIRFVAALAYRLGDTPQQSRLCVLGDRSLGADASASKEAICSATTVWGNPDAPTVVGVTLLKAEASVAPQRCARL